MLLELVSEKRGGTVPKYDERLAKLGICVSGGRGCHSKSSVVEMQRYHSDGHTLDIA